MSEFSELETLIQSYPVSREVAFTCSSSGKGVYLQAWDVATGAILRTYTSDSSSGEPTCVCMAGEDYILCALKQKPLIFVWRTHWEHIHLRIACTGIVNSLSCHPEGVYCVGAITDKINVWEVSSGHLLAQLARHYQSVSRIHFLSNGHHFLSGGQDGLVITWNLASVLSQERLKHCRDSVNSCQSLRSRSHFKASGPVHIWSDHSTTVTGIASINGAELVTTETVITCSLDMTCKLYRYPSGVLLGTFLCSSPLTCVTPSPDGLWLLAGGNHGNIEAVPLFLPDNTTSAVESNVFSFTLRHHKSCITELIFTSNGNLISTSTDSSAVLWDITSKQVVKTIKHKGPVIGLLRAESDAPLSRISPRFPLKKHFGKQLSYSRDGFDHEVLIRTGDVAMLSQNATKILDDICGDDIVSRFSFEGQVDIVIDEQYSYKNEDAATVKEMTELRNVHKKLYAFAMDRLLP